MTTTIPFATTPNLAGFGIPNTFLNQVPFGQTNPFFQNTSAQINGASQTSGCTSGYPVNTFSQSPSFWQGQNLQGFVQTPGAFGGFTPWQSLTPWQGFSPWQNNVASFGSAVPFSNNISSLANSSLPFGGIGASPYSIVNPWQISAQQFGQTPWLNGTFHGSYYPGFNGFNGFGNALGTVSPFGTTSPSYTNPWLYSQIQSFGGLHPVSWNSGVSPFNTISNTLNPWQLSAISPFINSFNQTAPSFGLNPYGALSPFAYGQTPSSGFFGFNQGLTPIAGFPTFVPTPVFFNQPINGQVPGVVSGIPTDKAQMPGMNINAKAA